ncbi:hypothetical protein GGI04_000691 [Coemansia thaxteri]|nr:hypothetical protein GGI04_000691 [Coemansia thaxteri]KAJ2473715.1 hypothetical protein GGI02_000641 [Coemansia sp. RSA 2322]
MASSTLNSVFRTPDQSLDKTNPPELALNHLPTIFVPDHVDLLYVQKCLADRHTNFVPVNASFDAELHLKKRRNRFLVLEKDHFVHCSLDYEPIKFSYTSRNAVMSHMWEGGYFANISDTNYVNVDGLWQLERLPVLLFVFGRDADTLKSSYLVDDNTISEFYEADVATDMARLAAVAQSKMQCVSHFFVVNRGKEYWAVNITDPSNSYAFGPTTKTRVISRLANGSATIQDLIDEGQPLVEVGPRTNQSPGFKLRDCNGEEVVEGEQFALQIVSGRGEDDDSEDPLERHDMYEGKDWVNIFSSPYRPGMIPLVYGGMDYGAHFGMAVVNSIVHLTFDGHFLQIGGDDEMNRLIVQPSVPLKHKAIQIGYSSDGNIILRAWETDNHIVCEWLKASSGYIGVEDAMDVVHGVEPMKLRLVKVKSHVTI